MMNYAFKKWLSLFIALALVISLVPFTAFVKAEERAPIVITDPLGTEQQPTQVNKPTINISGSAYGVTDLGYTITQYRIDNGRLIEIKHKDGADKPDISGSNFTFNDVQLYEGLNGIKVYGIYQGQTVSDTKYVEYTNLPFITSVLYNDSQDLRQDNRITDDLTYNNNQVMLTGKVYNADSIVAVVNGVEYDGLLMKLQDEFAFTDLPLQLGKNSITIQAENQTKTYPLTLDVYYEPQGVPYILGQIDGQDLLPSMNFSTKPLTVSGDVYNFNDANDQLKVTYNGGSFIITRNDFDSQTTISGSIATNDGQTTNYTLTNEGADSFTLEFDTIKHPDINDLSFTFTLADGTTYQPQTYKLKYLNTSSNYVVSTSGLSDTATIRTLTFYITTSNTVTDLDQFINHVYVDGNGTRQTNAVPVANIDATKAPTYKVTVDLQPGDNFFEVYPAAPESENMEIYTVQYVSTPDVKITNLVNGDRIGGTDGLNIDTMIGEFINIPTTEMDNMTITVENAYGSTVYTNQSALLTIDKTNGTFSFSLTDLGVGANEITIEVTDGAVRTKTKLTLFYFKGDGPFVDITPSVSSRYTLTETDTNIFETDSRYIDLTMNFNNAKELVFYYNGQRAVYIDVQNDKVYPEATGNDIYLKLDLTNNKVVTDRSIRLNDGANTFEIEAISQDGSSKSAKIYVTRSPQPVKLIQPVLPDQKVVNSNFIEVIIEAEAEQVIIDKTEAVAEPISDSEAKQFKADVFLKNGKNKITYTVVRNGNSSKYQFEIYYAATPKEGARYKEVFTGKGKMDVFDKKVLLEFPKNTWLIEKGSSSIVDYKADEYLDFSIVNRKTGQRIIWDGDEYTFEDFNGIWDRYMKYYILPPDNTGYAGQLYWIEANGDLTNVDAGLVPNNQGEITIQFDQSIRDDAQNLLAIYHFDPEKREWVNLGGVVNTKAKTVTAPINEFGYYTVMAKRGSFNDIVKHPWAANYLQTMYSKGLMIPAERNRFGADLLTTRGELATLLVKALDIPIDAGPYDDRGRPINPTFKDVSPLLDPDPEFYSYEYIETAARAGIIRGESDGLFNPDGYLTREQAATMIARAANLKITSNAERSKLNLAKMFADGESINLYAAPYIEAVIKAKVMSGSQSGDSIVFNPRSFMSRAEAATISYRLMQKLKKLPK
uniref:S-layer homology domain-containing protein n=1 Tax=Tepidibacillus infernus TaxID=1806172 RepID=UPI003BADB24C